MDAAVYVVETQKAFPAFKKINAAATDANDDAGDLQLRYGANRLIQPFPQSLNCERRR